LSGKLICKVLSIRPDAATTEHTPDVHCENLYVGRVWVEKGYGLRSVMLLIHPSNHSGSYWTLSTGWKAKEKGHALSFCTIAKLAGHRVNVTTSELDGCGVSK